MSKQPLTNQEKAYFDTIKQVASSPRAGDLALRRMTLDGREVAVIMQRVIDSQSAATVGYQPLALILDDATTGLLRDVGGDAPKSMPPEGLEGAA